MLYVLRSFYPGGALKGEGLSPLPPLPRGTPLFSRLRSIQISSATELTPLIALILMNLRCKLLPTKGCKKLLTKQCKKLVTPQCKKLITVTWKNLITTSCKKVLDFYTYRCRFL